MWEAEGKVSECLRQHTIVSQILQAFLKPIYLSGGKTTTTTLDNLDFQQQKTQILTGLNSQGCDFHVWGPVLTCFWAAGLYNRKLYGTRSIAIYL